MGLGDFISGIFGSKNEYHADAKAAQTDPNAFQYGGHQGGADQAAGQAQFQGGVNNAAQSSYDNQQNSLYNTGNVQLQAGNQALGQAQGARNAQLDALGMAQRRANGQDLISQRIAGQQSNTLAQQQASAAASARGPAGLALAQQNAANNTSTGQANIAANAGIAGAQEQLANQQAYAGQASGIRGQDIGTAGTSYGAAGTAFGAGAQSGALGIASGQLGLGYSQLGNQIQSTQLGAQQNQQALNSANTNSANAINAGVAGQNAGTNNQNAWGAVSAGANLFGGATALGGGSGGGGKAVGGHVGGAHPYLVGEQGPELIVPKKDGFVFTAPQTEMLMRTLTPQQARALGGGVSGYAREGGGSVDGTSFVAPGDEMYAQAPSANPPGFQPAVTGAEQRLAENQRVAAIGGNEPNPAEGLGWTTGISAAPMYGAEGGPLRDRKGAGTPENASVLEGMQAAGVKTQEPKAKGEAEAARAKRPGVADLIGNAAKAGQQGASMSGGTFYAPQTYAAPTFIAPRAMGGPIAAFGAPGGDPNGAMVLTPDGGGLDVMGSLRATNAADTQFLKSPGFAREDGGPVAGQTASDAAGDAGQRAGNSIVDSIVAVPSYIGGLQAALIDRSPAIQGLRALGIPFSHPGETTPAPAPAPVPRGVASDKQPVFIYGPTPRTSDKAMQGHDVVPPPGSGPATAPKKKVDEEVSARADGGCVRGIGSFLSGAKGKRK